MLYTLSTPDWQNARRQTDIYLVSLDRGLPSTRQLTFTKDKNETSPKWSRDGSFIAFLSDRDAAAGAAAGGAVARRCAGGGRRGWRQQPALRDASRRRRGGKLIDGRAKASRTSRSARTASRSCTRPAAPTTNNSTAFADRRPRQDSPKADAADASRDGSRSNWQLSPDGMHIYFVTPDSIDRDERARTDKQFTVRSAQSGVVARRASGCSTSRPNRSAGSTSDTSYSVGDVTISPDGKWIGFHGMSASRYERGNLEQNDYADLYLLRRREPARSSA